MTDDKSKPSSREVKEFHTNSDRDGSVSAIHHTLGPGKDQAAPGNHTHDGGTSKTLMESIVVSGSRGGNLALQSLISALSEALGFTDNTTV